MANNKHFTQLLPVLYVLEAPARFVREPAIVSVAGTKREIARA